MPIMAPIRSALRQLLVAAGLRSPLAPPSAPLTFYPASLRPGAATGSAAGQAVTTLKAGGIWAISVANGAFSINSSTGAMVTTGAVTTQVYAPTLTYTPPGGAAVLLPLTISVFNPPLNTLVISITQFQLPMAPGAVLATITGQTIGSTFTETDANGYFAVSTDGTQLLAGANAAAAAAGSYVADVIETNATASPTTSPNNWLITLLPVAQTPPAGGDPFFGSTVQTWGSTAAVFGETT